MPSSIPAEVRQNLIDALQLDLIGPPPDDAVHAEEILPEAPSKWYLTGFLVPYGAPIEQRSDDTANDELDEVSRVSSGDDEIIPEKTFARKAFFPSSIGLSILISEKTTELNVTVQWGDYLVDKGIVDNGVADSKGEGSEEEAGRLEDTEGGIVNSEYLSDKTSPRNPKNSSLNWRRIPQEVELKVTLSGPLNSSPTD